MDADAVGEAADLLDEVGAAVVDDLGVAMVAGEGDLLRAAGGADGGGADMGEPLAEEEADAACRRMDDDGHAGFDPEGGMGEIMRGHPLEGDGGGNLVGDAHE